MKTRQAIRSAVIIGAVAALYAALTLAIAPLSFGAVQVRFSEILVLLCFYRKEYGISMILGCAAANLFSPMGTVDVIFGTLATAVAVTGVYLIGKRKKGKNDLPRLIAASLVPVISNGLIVGAELYYALDVPFAAGALSVAAGELLAVSVAGVAVFTALSHNTAFMRLIKWEYVWEK